MMHLGTRNPEPWLGTLNGPSSLQNSSTCWVCNGYYGPSYEEPVCGACHSFLFSSSGLEEGGPTRGMPEDSDDEDSGNDEPPYNAAGVNPSHSNANVNVAAAVAQDDNMEEDDDEEEVEEDEDDPEDVEDMPVAVQRPPAFNELPLVRPRPNPPRNVLQYLDLLSIPRQNDRNDPRIDALATEVLLGIFSYLDDLSLASVSRVCRRWHNIVQTYTNDEMWCQYTKKRWPLFQEICRVPSWLELFATLMDSCFCRTCLIDMAQKIPEDFGGNNYLKIRRLKRENDQLTDGIEFVAIDDQLTHLSASIVGPPGSPYEGGKFFLYIVVPQFYPMNPPTVRFLTKILHPNISRHGDVAIDIIQHNWSLALTIPKILLSVQSLLTDPFTEICMEPVLGRMYDHDRPRFEMLAKHWTLKYAMHELIPPV